MTNLLDLTGASQRTPSYALKRAALPTLTLHVTSGIGSGPNTLAAYDAALFDAGIANFNLIYLSSVIPTGAQVVRKPAKLNDSSWGDRLYVVMAEEKAMADGEEAWAGIGWIQDEETGNGLFVEHHAGSQDEVEGLITDSLTSMRSYRDDTFGPVQMHTVGAAFEDLPVTALCAVVYGAEPWAVATVADLR